MMDGAERRPARDKRNEEGVTENRDVCWWKKRGVNKAN